jgi:hypothetical protein
MKNEILNITLNNTVYLIIIILNNTVYLISIYMPIPSIESGNIYRNMKVIICGEETSLKGTCIVCSECSVGVILSSAFEEMWPP